VAPGDQQWNTIPIETVDQCFLCLSERSRRIHARTPFAFVMCEGCGLVRLSPRVAFNYLPTFYDHVNQIYDENDLDLEQQIANPTFDVRAARLERYARGRRFFEVGCGDGNFLEVMRRRGWTVSGCEASDSAISVVSRRYGIDVKSTSFTNFQIDGRWDAIGLYQVLEHLYEPRQMLQGVRTAMADDAIVHLQLPSFHSADAQLGGMAWPLLSWPEHTYLYGRKQLHRLLTEEGFRVVSIRTYYDPWHSPRAVAQTIRARLRSILPGPKSGLGISADGALAEGARARAGVRPAAAAALARAIYLFGVGFARTEAAVGWGNMLEAIAERSR
jgi:SAM-dependent methyltransferase